MRIRCGPSLPHRHSALFLLLLLLLLASCSREELALVDLQTNVAIHVHPAEGRKEQLLTLVFTLTGQPAEKQVHVVAGNQKSSWVVKARSDERSTYTIGPLSMGSDVLLPKGQWSLSILSSDGQTLEEVFVVDYPTFKELVAYDRATHTLTLATTGALLSLYDRDGALLSTHQLEPDSDFFIDETAETAVVYVEKQNATYTITC